MTNIKVALTNLGKYNEGELVFKWLELPASEDEIKQAMEEIGIGSKRWDGGVYEEYFITDFEAPFEIGEYDNLIKLNEFAEEFDLLDDDQLLAFNAWYIEINSDRDDALETALRGEYVIYKNCDDMADVAKQQVDFGYFNIESDNYLLSFIDYEALGECLADGGHYVFIDGDCVEFYR